MTKVYYDKEKKQSAINSLNNIILDLNKVNNSFYNTFVPTEFYYYHTLGNLKVSLIDVKKELDEYKNKINNITERINKDELEIMQKVNKIDEPIIEKF